MGYTVFSIDGEDKPRIVEAFERQLQRVTQDARLPVRMVGSYKGVRENSFIVNSTYFDTYVRGSSFLRNQESVMHVASGNKMEAVLEFLQDGRVEGIGCLHVVCEKEAMASEAYSYRPDMNTYWVAKHGNPDDSLKNSIKEYM